MAYVIKISELEQLFRDIFEEEDGKVSSVDTVYESTEDNFLKLVISIQNLSIEDTLIIHTKFIFKVDSDKRNVIENRDSSGNSYIQAYFT